LPDADTNAFDNNVMELPVLTSTILNHSDNGQVTYWVEGYSAFSGFVDATDNASFNVKNPGLFIEDGTDIGENAFGLSFNYYPLFWLDNDGTSLSVRRDKAQLQTDGASKLLLIHQNNVSGDTAEILDVADPTETSLSLSRSKAPYSGPVSAVVNVTSATDPQPTGDVQLLVDGVVAKTATLSDGTATIRLPRLDVGTYDVAARYVGNGPDAASTSDPATLTVVKQSTATSLAAKKATVKKGNRDVFTATVTRTNGRAQPVGDVRFKLDGEVWDTVTLVDGVAKIAETNFAKGTHRVTAVYLGNKNQARSKDSVTITVT
jgi:hypothetical protein